MEIIGRLESIWRYPVKGMRGEEINEVFVGFGGVMGDRVYGVINAQGEKGFPWFTARDEESFLLYHPSFKQDGNTVPQNLDEFEGIAPGIHPLFPTADSFSVDVKTPEGESYDIESEDFSKHLNERFDAELTVHCSGQKSQVDCRPLSLFSKNTSAQLSEELDMDIDYRRFRPNFLVSWEGQKGFYGHSLVDKKLRIGGKLEITILERDPRCKMVTLDPDTGEGTPKILKHISTKHEGFAGSYGAVLKEGTVKAGDEIVLV